MGTLRTERLILRCWRPSDRDPFFRLNADPRVMKFLLGILSQKESDLLMGRLEAHFRQHGFGLCAVELCVDHSFVGFIGLSVPTFHTAFTPCVEIGWRLSADYWGQGLATEGAAEMVHYAFEVLRLESLVSFTVPTNIRSRRVMEKLRMVHDAGDDFDHPNLPEDRPLRRHVLYRLSSLDWNHLSTIRAAAPTTSPPRSSGRHSSVGLNARLQARGVERDRMRSAKPKQESEPAQRNFGQASCRASRRAVPRSRHRENSPG
jgi:RimJ/RimL family protein N-acetyltransferase